MESLHCDVHMSREYVIVSRGSQSLWCSRKDGSLKPGSVVTPENLESSHYLAKCYGMVGKIQFFAGAEWKLLLIGSASSVGVLPGCGKVYCVEKLIIIPLTTEPSPEIYGLEREPSPAPSRRGTAAKSEAAAGVGGGGGGGGGGKQREGKEKDKLEKRLMEALLRMFNDSHSFYFCTEGDLTHTQQRTLEHSSTSSDPELPFWNKVDERFFWNKWMLQDLLDITCQRALVEPWILPLIQGYVEIRTLVVHSSNPPDVLQAAQRSSQRGSHRDSEAGDEEEDEEDLMKIESNPTIQIDEIEDCSRSDASGYESDSSSSSDDEVEEGSGEDGDKDMWSYGLQSEGEKGGESSLLPGVARETGRDSRGSSESYEMTSQRDDPLKMERVRRKRGLLRRPLLERLRLVRRSNSPDRPREDTTEDTKWKELQGTGDNANERLVVVGGEGGEEGEWGDGGEYGEGRVEGVEAGDERSQLKEEVDKDDYTFTLSIISRRSRHRAGTRYRRRGVDALGNVANFVETEMILQAGSHHVSYVLVRGSVPVFWTQPGIKYRPPPVIERDEEETQEAFKKHFDRQISLYGSVAITNLINQSGREAVLGEPFEHHVLSLDSPHITYITFDFHRHFKANPNGAIKQLVDATHNLNKKFRFCWVDTSVASGPLCRQDGVFRVNCIDCLDRTNVVQTAFCKEVLQSALQKLGIIPFDEHLSGAMLTTYKIMWANNGDCLSRQYTGTAAMKGDLTRYGERKISGLMKDGYNSAHRYYQNLFRDSYRQVLIDLMQGISYIEAFSSLPPSLRGSGEGEGEEGEEEVEELWSLEREQAIAEMIQLCREELFPNKTLSVVGWALVEAAGYSFVEMSRKEEDCVLLQCREQNQLCVASYNAEDDQVNCCIRIPMQNVNKIVIGPLGTILRSSHRRLHMRLYYTLIDQTKQCYFTFKTVNFTSMDEDRDTLLSIASTLANICPTIIVQERKLSKKRSPAHQGIIYLLMPKEMVNDDEWGTTRGESISPRPHDPPELLHLAEGGDDGCGLDDDDMKEHSLSMPASPTLHHRPLHSHGRVQRQHSQSFDDILSSVNNEEDLLPSPSPITVGKSSSWNRSRGRNVEIPPPLLSSGSDSDEEPHPQPQCGLGVAYNHTLLVSSQPEITPSSSLPLKGTGKFNQLRGKLFQKVRREKNLQVPQQSTHSDRATSGSGSDTGGQPDNTETSSLNQLSHMTNRLLAVGQRFRNSPPSLLRRMGVGGRGQTTIQAPPEVGNKLQETRSEARNKSQTTFITL